MTYNKGVLFLKLLKFYYDCQYTLRGATASIDKPQSLTKLTVINIK